MSFVLKIFGVLKNIFLRWEACIHMYVKFYFMDVKFMFLYILISVFFSKFTVISSLLCVVVVLQIFQ